MERAIRAFHLVKKIIDLGRISYIARNAVGIEFRGGLSNAINIYMTQNQPETVLAQRFGADKSNSPGSTGYHCYFCFTHDCLPLICNSFPDWPVRR